MEPIPIRRILDVAGPLQPTTAITPDQLARADLTTLPQGKTLVCQLPEGLELRIDRNGAILFVELDIHFNDEHWPSEGREFSELFIRAMKVVVAQLKSEKPSRSLHWVGVPMLMIDADTPGKDIIGTAVERCALLVERAKKVLELAARGPMPRQHPPDRAA